jgi:hypothetical protein
VHPPDASDDLVISTPERVAFQYEIAGIGSRFLAQILDSLVITVVLIAITILAVSLGGITGSGTLALLIEIILGFILLAGYFLVSEAAWNGQSRLPSGRPRFATWCGSSTSSPSSMPSAC